MPLDYSEVYNFPLGERRRGGLTLPPWLMGGGSTAFNPLTLSPAVWLKADAGLYQERTGASATTAASVDGDAVGTWLDQSGNARHLTAGTDGARPTYKPNIQNSLPGVLLDGVNDGLSVASFPLGVFTIFTVFRLTGTAGIIYEHSVNAGANDGHYLYGTTGNTANVRRTGADAVTAGATGSGVSAKNLSANWAVDNAAKLVVHQHSGTHAGHVLRIGGVTQTLSDVSSDNTGTVSRTTTYHLGARNGGASLPSSGYLFEHLVYPFALTADQISSVEQYLSRWGV